MRNFKYLKKSDTKYLLTVLFDQICKSYTSIINNQNAIVEKISGQADFCHFNEPELVVLHFLYKWIFECSLKTKM